MREVYNGILRLIVRCILITITTLGIAIANVATNTSQTNFLVFSDIHLDVKPSTPPMEINPYGYSSHNDLDKATFTTMLGQISTAINDGIIQHPAFILLQGDLAGYDRSYSTETYDDEKYVLQQINQAFPNIPILSVFGNNDSLEKDYGVFYYPPGIQDTHSQYEIALTTGWHDGYLSTGKQCLISSATYPCIINEDKINGYYSAYIASHLRLISLNSVMFAASKHNTSQQNIADQQLAWLETQLVTARLRNDSVLIVSHIPFGNNIFDNSAFWRTADQEPFYNLLSRYKNNIIGVLSGHTHMEELKVLKDNANNNVGALVFTAGLSTSHGNAPSVKTFFLGRSFNNWSITNYETFNFLNNAANVFSLHKLYDFASYYCTNKPQNIFECLSNVNANKLHPYYSAGNPNYGGTIGAPNDVFVTLPNTSNSGITSNNNNNDSNTNYGLLGAIGAAGVGALIIGTASSN